MHPQTDPTLATALVTGAGRGLGRHLALELARCGLKVAALGRSGADLDTLAELSEHIHPVVVDVGDPQALRQAFDALDQDLGPVDTLFNNAAVYPHLDFLEETPESFSRTMDINLGGIVTTSMLALARMTDLGYGRIINVTSYADLRPTHLSSAYSVSKGAGRILTRAIVTDLGDRFPDIVVNDWIPGALNTTMGIPDGHDPAHAARWGVGLALWRDRGLNGLTFMEDREELPLLSLKRRIFNKIAGQARAPRQISLPARTRPDEDF